MTEENNKSAPKQELHKEVGIIYFFIALILMGVIFMFVMQFFTPGCHGCRWGCDHGGAVSISRKTYHRATGDIRSIIAG